MSREPETADFSAARVQGPRRRMPFVVAGWLVVLGSVVALGLSGRSTESAAGGGTVQSTRPTADTPPGTAPPATFFRIPDFPATPAPAQTSGPGPIQLQAARQANTVFVHGDVYAADITWVFCSLQGPDGSVAGWASVSVPGSAGPATASGQPTLRFDVELAVPSDVNQGSLSVLAHAYDSHGLLVSAASVDLRPPGALPSPR